MEDLRQALKLDTPPVSIECFDISNISGTLAVAFLEKGYHAPAVLDFITLCRRTSGEWV